MVYSSEKLAVFIDGQALNAFGEGLGMKIDYLKFKKRFALTERLTSINYYAFVDEDKTDNPYIKLLDFLNYNGYRIHKKRRCVGDDSVLGRGFKSSLIVDLSIDLVLMARHVDHIVFVGANGNYSYPVAKAQRLCARITLLSSLKVDGMHPSDTLRRVADEFIELDDIRHEISTQVREIPVRKIA